MSEELRRERREGGLDQVTALPRAKFPAEREFETEGEGGEVLPAKKWDRDSCDMRIP